MRKKLPKSKKRSVNVTVPLTETEKDAIERAAEKERQPPAQWARNALMVVAETVNGKR